MKKIVLVFALCVILLFTAPAYAEILDYGVNIYSSGYTPVAFFDGDDTGRWLGGGLVFPTTLTLTLDTASVFSNYTINSASLFVDAVGIAPGFWWIPANAGTVSVQGSNLGQLANTAHVNTNVPLIGGGTAHTPYFGDVDNSFYDLGALGINLNDLATDSTFTIAFNRTSGIFRVDGINIQVDGTRIPEPATLSLLGLGLIGFFAKFKKERG